MCSLAVDGAALPKFARDGRRCDLQISPPRHPIALAMQITMVITAQRHCELVADLSTQRAGLGELQMVGIAGQAFADQTGLSGHKS